MSKRAFVLSVCTAATLLATAASASAANLWVSSTTPVSSPHSSCVHPGYSTIQSAIAIATSGSSIHVCPGTYTEQLVITEPLKLVAVDGAGSAKVVLPGSPAISKTACDEVSLAGLKKQAKEQREKEELEQGKPVTEGVPQPDEDAVSICTSGTVGITGLTFEPKWALGTCNDSLYGILVAGGATLVASNMAVDGGGAFPINGCQGGIGIQVGMAWSVPIEAGHATLTHDTVGEYQKNGITIDGKESSAKISTTIVTGAGPTPETAQNGIQVSNGALATIQTSTISGNECDNASCGSNAFAETQATGVLFYGAAHGSKVTSSTLKENDIGAYFVSTNPTQPHTPEVTISQDEMNADRYEGVALDQGDASVKSDTIDGPGNIGIELFQYEQQTYAPTSSASGDTIENMRGAAVEVQSDKAPGDDPGSFTISNSSFLKDAQALDDESSTFTVVL
ncbi:MAG TPA: hypothetical protein VN892_01475 [Solirubrobacteraceae bacterium]|nr:hypothetical protein [Solirubrobacteraceae bacterium]